MMWILLILIIIVGCILLKVNTIPKKITIIVMAILLLVFVSIFVINKLYKNISPNWIMRVEIEGFDGGYGNKVYIYSNNKMIIEPYFTLNPIVRKKLNENININEVYNYIINSVDASIYGNDKYYYRIVFNTDEHEQGRLVKHISPNDENLKEFLAEIPLDLFANAK